MEVTFFGQTRTGRLLGPCADYVAEKARFGASRVKRWFGKDWNAP